MAILVQFKVTGATISKYEEVIRRLTAMGLRIPDGQLYHVCYGDPNNLQVIDIFETSAQLEAFGAKLAPILQEFGIEAVPSMSPVHNIIHG